MGGVIAQYAPAKFSGEITQSILFFIVFNLFSTVINLPFNYYKTFVLEEKFGFNQQTKKLVGVTEPVRETWPDFYLPSSSPILLRPRSSSLSLAVPSSLDSLQ